MRGRLIVEQDVITPLRDRTLGDLSLRDVKHIGRPPSHTLTPLTCYHVSGSLRPPSLLAGQSLRNLSQAPSSHEVSTVVTTTHHSTHFARLVLGHIRYAHVRRHVASSPSDRGAESQLPGIGDHRNPAQAHAGTRENKTCGGATKTGPTSFPRVHPAPAPALMILSLSPRMHVTPRVPEIPSMVLFLGPRKER